jgi:putative membrane protein
MRARSTDFFDATARTRIHELVTELERGSAAELIVAVHPRSARYRESEWLAGTALALVWLAVFLYHPEPFDFTFLPLELGVSFLVGALVTRAVGPIKRALSSTRAVHAEVDRAAKTAFHDLGVSRTRARTGLLVFVSMLEGRAQIVSDVGVPKLELFATLAPRLDRAVRRRDFGAFATLLAELGPALAEALPKAHDDDNELADELVEGA